MGLFNSLFWCCCRCCCYSASYSVPFNALYLPISLDRCRLLTRRLVIFEFIKKTTTTTIERENRKIVHEWRRKKETIINNINEVHSQLTNIWFYVRACIHSFSFHFISFLWSFVFLIKHSLLMTNKVKEWNEEEVSTHDDARRVEEKRSPRRIRRCTADRKTKKNELFEWMCAHFFFVSFEFSSNTPWLDRYIAFHMHDHQFSV